MTSFLLPGMRRVAAMTFALILCVPMASAQPAGEARLALLIGNASYNRSPLANPVNDVRLMERTLRQAGFQVLKAENASRRDMQRLLREFGERLKQSGGVGLFYFAGHGVQVRGVNYLLPVDADIRAEDEVAYDAIDAQAVLDKMETARNRVNILILDACRDNPFSRSRSVSSGLATMTAPSGSLVAYATAPGAVASDGDGNNGLYTRHLASLILTPGLPVEEVFKQVRSAVRRDSKNQQTPWENTALEGQFYFRPAPVATSPKPADISSEDVAAWERARSSVEVAEVQSYLDRFPQGVFAEVARLRLESIREAAARKPVTPQSVGNGTPVAVTTPRPSESAVNVRQVMLSRDGYTGREVREEVTAMPLPEGGVRWSIGHEVAPDGQLRAVRIGSWTGRVQDGALWKFPLVVGSSGTAHVTSPTMRGAGEVRWRVTQGNGATRIVEASVFYEQNLGPTGGPPGANTVRGSWTAEYEDGMQVPVRVKNNFRANNMGSPDFSTAEVVAESK